MNSSTALTFELFMIHSANLRRGFRRLGNRGFPPRNEKHRFANKSEPKDHNDYPWEVSSMVCMFRVATMISYVTRGMRGMLSALDMLGS